MSVERSFEAWEEVQRHGHELADRLAHGFSGLLHPPPFSWPHSSSSPSAHKKPPFDLHLAPVTADGVSAILDIGSQLGRAGAEFGACLNGVVEQFFRQIPVPFGGTSAAALRADLESRSDDVAERPEELRLAAERLGDSSALEAEVAATGLDEFADEDAIGLDLRDIGQFGRPQGTVNITSTYDSRTHDIESSFVARGGLWRAEASHGGSTSGNDNPPHFLVQLGPVLFVRDSTLLLPVHLSKHHLLWYGYDRKNGLHSLCPALWSKHRRWLLMSMICLNPLACSFMDLQFPNGQLTYVAGEGLTTSAFFPVLGGLLQAHGQLPGEMRFSFSYKNEQGTLITPMVQWPDKSFSLGVVQALAWRRYGLMERPSIEFSICPTFGGSNPGLHAEFIHSLKEKLSLIFGCDCAIHPSAFASLSLGRSKWNGHVGKSGIVIRVEAPLSNIGRPSFSVQLNTGVEF